ncbi:hypothetical protein OG21DRAFT_144583, partial [Imleria badia]
NSWCNQSLTQSTRSVQKVELCTALCTGEDAWGTPLGKDHHHTLLRVFLVPTCNGPDAEADTLLIERVLSTGGAYHSVTPITETFPAGGTLFHPNIHDRVCIIIDGPCTALAHDLHVERTFPFGDSALILTQFSEILAFVGRTTELICDGGDCRFQSRSFAFTCLVALSPTLPPRKAGDGAGTRVVGGPEMVDDSVFELGSEAFLVQVPWLVRDPASIEALKLIEALKDKPREMGTRLYH